MVADEIKVERLVQEYLAAQSLKILPQAPFGDAVSQFVNKDDKHALEAFVSQSLADQVRQMLNLDPDDDNLESAIARYREKMEQQFASGQRRLAARRRYKPKPDDWDSDMDGHWEDQPEAIEQEPTQATNRAASGSARDRERQQSDDEDALMVDAPLPEQYLEVEDEEEEEPPPRPAARGRTATTRATKAAPAKAAPAKKPPARGRRNGKAVVEEEDEEEEADAFVDDGFEPEPPPPPPRQPARRAAAAARATTRAAPQKKATAAPATRSSARPTRQTQLSFVSQQRPTQTAVEISDDEISDDDEFETMPSLRSRRR